MTAETPPPPGGRATKADSKKTGEPPHRDYRDALAAFPTGVTVVTCFGVNGAAEGMTVNSFASISLEPKLVSWAMGASCLLEKDFTGATHFAVNILSADQSDLCDRFATMRDRMPLNEREYTVVEGGAPCLNAAATVFDCRKVQEIPLGDHLLLVGEVGFYRTRPAKPLLFHGSKIITDGRVD